MERERQRKRKGKRGGREWKEWGGGRNVLLWSLVHQYRHLAHYIKWQFSPFLLIIFLIRTHPSPWLSFFWDYTQLLYHSMPQSRRISSTIKKCSKDDSGKTKRSGIGWCSIATWRTFLILVIRSEILKSLSQHVHTSWSLKWKKKYKLYWARSV